MNIDIEAVKKRIDIINFKQVELLKIALTHPSYVYEITELTRQQQEEQERDYRRLAHLGDAIINAIVTDYLLKYRSDLNKDHLTKLKQKLVNRKQLAEFAQELNLRQICLLGGSEKGKEQDEYKDHFGEMFEALLGAIYLEFERNFSNTGSWLIEHFIKEAVDDLFDNESKDDFDENVEELDWRSAIDDDLLIWYYEYADNSD
ncbi:hypothetical protein C7Y66_14215 [Chroococcidiopsis sp. CCALA 051]|uniref:ribonuclease III domain-containing protein n=1 Tax=Chroococcidiopsis sp. CCALA 051 TaxID=869949 RepID=UPI000D0D7CEF|nr:ribonuclease III domain-containing protein [Chroococcidiopsis sp. CCALA 051]PSM48464.1 hypothetical protein C7Y66_14215 [Chroococcidiopsis sp. CCALA 051]